MYPPIYSLAKADPNVVSHLGNPPRFYLFGEAPQGVASPYAVWQSVYGTPENYLGTRPDADSYGLQVDVYAATAARAREVAEALSYSLESTAHVTAWNGEWREPDTKLYRSSFTVEFWVKREPSS